MLLLLHLLLLLMLLLLMLMLLLNFCSADSLNDLRGVDAAGVCKVDGVASVVRFQMSLKIVPSPVRLFAESTCEWPDTW